MGIFSRFERGMEDGLEGAASKLFNAPITPVQISKKAERAMHHEKMVGAGKQYAPTLYTVLVNPQDDSRLFGYYPTLAGETETYLSAKAAEEGFLMDGQPLVRFIADSGLRRGKFEIVAELVSAPIIAQLRQEEMRRYGLATGRPRQSKPQQAERSQERAEQRARQIERPQSNAFEAELLDVQDADDAGAVQQAAEKPKAKRIPLPYVPEDEIDRSIDYGEYTFDSQDWDSYQERGLAAQPNPSLQADADDEADPAKRTPERENEQASSRAASKPEPEPASTYEPEPEPEPEPLPEPSHETDLSGLDVEAYTPSSSDYDDYDSPMMVPNTASFDDDYDEPRAAARLLNNAGTQSIELDARRLIMGRSNSCDIVLDDINASRNHAELVHEDNDDWVINDLGSTNGTLVNGRRITSRTLYEGDRIRIGTNDFIFSRK